MRNTHFKPQFDVVGWPFPFHPVFDPSRLMSVLSHSSVGWEGLAGLHLGPCDCNGRTLLSPLLQLLWIGSYPVTTVVRVQFFNHNIIYLCKDKRKTLSFFVFLVHYVNFLRYIRDVDHFANRTLPISSWTLKIRLGLFLFS